MSAEAIEVTEAQKKAQKSVVKEKKEPETSGSGSGFIKRAAQTILVIWTILIGATLVTYAIYLSLNIVGVNITTSLSISLGISIVLILLTLLLLPKSFLLIKKEDICTLTPFTLLTALRRSSSSQSTEFAARLAQVESKVNELEMTSVQVESKVNKLEATSVQVESKVNKLEATSVQVESKVNRLETTLAQVQDQVKQSKSKGFLRRG